MSAFDLSTYILASFSTVDEVRHALDPANFTVVNYQLSQAGMAVLLKTGLLGPIGQPMIHLAVHDTKHDSLVIEFEGDYQPSLLYSLRSGDVPAGLSYCSRIFEYVCPITPALPK